MYLRDSGDRQERQEEIAAPAAAPEPEIQITRHKPSDRMPEEIFAAQRRIGEDYHPVYHCDLVETLTLGPETGDIGRHAAEHKGSIVFRWAWASEDMVEKDFLTVEQAREDLIIRLHMNAEATEQDRRYREARAAAENAEIVE